MRCQKCGKLLDDKTNVCPVCNTHVQQRTNNTTTANQYNKNYSARQNDAPQEQTVSTQGSSMQSDDKPRSMGATVLDFSLRIALILGILIYEIIAGVSTVSVSISIVILTMLIASMVYSVRKKQNNQNQQGIPTSQNSINTANRKTESTSMIILDYGLRILLIIGILIYDIVADASTLSITISVIFLTLLLLSMVGSISKKQ